jgi:hypothetical protein
VFIDINFFIEIIVVHIEDTRRPETMLDRRRWILPPASISMAVSQSVDTLAFWATR